MGKQESVSYWFQYAKDLAKAERELKNISVLIQRIIRQE